MLRRALDHAKGAPAHEQLAGRNAAAALSAMTLRFARTVLKKEKEKKPENRGEIGSEQPVCGLLRAAVESGIANAVQSYQRTRERSALARRA